MYIDDSYKRTKDGKQYRRCLLRQSYRENGQIKKRTVANLSDCSDGEIQAMKLALQHKDNLSVLESIEGKLECNQGLAVGTIVLLKHLADKLEITRCLGNSQESKLALWQIMSRVIDQGSRLSSVRLAQKHAICDLIDLEGFCEDDLYDNLDWLCDNQRAIEKKLFKLRYGTKVKPSLYLYDVTSSYLEGVQNELGDWGYNRDGKKGKMQIVIGMLTDEEGNPVSVEVFKGNTNDLKTFLNQVKKFSEEFGIKEVTMVGDRGMIKSEQINSLKEHNFHYITAITKSQIETLLDNGIIQMELFDDEICEVEHNNVRYVLRRNPVRVIEIDKNRQSKIRKIKSKLTQQNKYLKEHSRAGVITAERKIKKLIKQLKLNDFITVGIDGRTLSLDIDEERKSEKELLDGCYVIKTDLTKEQASIEAVHQRYKDLALVEQGFRIMKTALLETRPIYVRKEQRTRGHVFVVMLAYCISRELKELWKSLDLTVAEGIEELDTICSVEVNIKKSKYRRVLKPRLMGKNLLKLSGAVLPDVLPCKGAIVVTRKKLVSERK